jgi:hypothetical protein
MQDCVLLLENFCSVFLSVKLCFYSFGTSYRLYVLSENFLEVTLAGDVCRLGLLLVYLLSAESYMNDDAGKAFF